MVWAPASQRLRRRGEPEVQRQPGRRDGQDASRGNPFRQLAVQEFRVATSNFKAEYEQAGTAVITAITRSGGNEFTGEVFGFYQDDSMVGQDFFSAPRRRGQPD